MLYIRQSAESLNELVNDLLDLAKVEAGRIDVRPATFSVTDLFAALRGALKPLQVNPAVDLVIGPAADMPMLHTDEGKLAQILRNLVSNALKFTEAGSVTVSAGIDRRREAIAFVVADTGIGIAPEHITKIFEEFSQVDSPLQRKQKGTGLGLPLSRKLAEILGGSLEAESRVGEGSVFRLLLPLSAAVSPVLRSAGDGPRQRLLVVDDETSFRYLVRQLLRDRPGLEIVEAVDGEDAVERLSEVAPDAILLDLHMPRRDGFDVFETIRRSDRLRGIPVLVATSQPVTASIEARLAGVAGFMPKKDLARERLVALLDRVAEQRSRP